MDNPGLTQDGIHGWVWDTGLYVDEGGAKKLVYLRLKDFIQPHEKVHLFFMKIVSESISPTLDPGETGPPFVLGVGASAPLDGRPSPSFGASTP